MNLDLRGDGRVAMIVGCASGLGRACAELFAAAGYRLALVDLDAAGGAAVAVAGGEGDGAAAFFPADVADAAAVRASVEWATERWGGLDFVVNTAGILGPCALLEDSVPSELERVLAVNLVGTANVLREAIRAFKALGGGGVVCVSSITAERGAARYPGYSASKAGVAALARSAARNSGRFNIRVNCLRPGSIAGTRLAPPRAAEEQRGEEMALMRQVPLGRPAAPADVAALVLFLASPLARHIHGAVLTIDGGESLGYQA
jgi:NAD(P)-dependent dehydrogenase (short-subunit alcohol dehydrogenase family)